MDSRMIGKCIDDYPTLKDLLPEEYEYELYSFKEEFSDESEEEEEDKEHDRRLNGRWFTAFVRTKTMNKKEIKTWLEKLSLSSGATFRVDRTHKPGSRTVFKVEYRCHQNTRPRKNSTPHAKHTKCNAKLTINVKNVKKPGTSKDEFLPDYPTVIMLRHTHNHPLFGPETLKFSAPPSELKSKFLKMFETGHSVSSALTVHTADVLEEHDLIDSHQILNDRRLIPSGRWVRHIYDSAFDKSRANIVEQLQTAVAGYNTKCGDCARIEIDEAQRFVLALCSPFMKRVVSVIHSFDVLVVETLTNPTRYLCNAYVLMVYCEAGCLPVGVLMGSAGKQWLNRAMKLYESLLSHPLSPAVILVSAPVEQFGALMGLFPGVKIMENYYNILRDLWKFLNNLKASDVPLKLVPHAFRVFKDLAILNPVELNSNCHKINLHPITQNYPRFQAKINEILAKMKQNVTTHEIVGENILLKTKAINPLQLFDYVTELDHVYSNKIDLILSNQTDDWFSSQFQIDNLPIDVNYSVSEIYDSIFNVKVNNIDCMVDSLYGFCSCNRLKCVHQLLLKKEKDLPSFNGDLNENQRMVYRKLLSDDSQRIDSQAPNVIPVKVTKYMLPVSLQAPYDVDRTKRALKEMFDDLTSQLHNNAQQFAQPIENFAQNYLKLKSEQDKINALNSYSSSDRNVFLLQYDFLTPLNQRSSEL